jgi:ABC-type branched-subunit amino acid transport system substrate-binding protein
MRRRVIVTVLFLGVIGTACGARVPAEVRNNAASAVLQQGGGGPVTSDGTSPDGTTPVTTGQGPSSSTNPSGPTTATNGQPSTTSTNPNNPTTTHQGQSNPHTGNSTGPKTSASGGCPSAGGTDVGLTSSSMVLGTVADRSGPVAGLFAGAQQGAVAFSQYENSLGGLCGRQVSIDFADSGTNCSQNQNDHESLVNKVFAFVGSFSLYDGKGCGATILAQHPTVPDIHVALDPSAETLPNHFDLMPGPLGYATGMYKYFKDKYGSKVQHVGTISVNIPSAQAKQNAQVNAAKSQGWKFVYSNAHAATTSNFTSNFQTACAKNHIQIFFTVTENAQNAAACKGVINIIPIAYDSAFVPDYQGSPSDLNGIQGYNEYSLFFNADEGRNIPEVALFQQWFKRTNPGQPLNLYAMFAWAEGRMLQDAFEHAKSADRKGVLAALHSLTNWSDNGLVSPMTPGSKTEGAHCYIVWQLNNGQFSRQSGDPKAGFRCDGKFLKYNG